MALYHILEDLFLPDPTSIVVPDRLFRLQNLRPVSQLKLKRSIIDQTKLLEDLNRRVMPSPSLDLNSEFIKFRLAESTSHTPAKPAQDLVRSSGKLDAPILFFWHYPSFTTNQKVDGEIANPSNQCTTLLIKAGFSPENSFWYNAYCRRERREDKKKVVHAKIYTPNTLELHHEWVDKQRQALSGKVEVVFGAENRASLLKNLVLEPLELWTEPPVKVHLQFSDTSKQTNYHSSCSFCAPPWALLQELVSRCSRIDGQVFGNSCCHGRIGLPHRWRNHVLHRQMSCI